MSADVMALAFPNNPERSTSGLMGDNWRYIAVKLIDR
jgi:hypothetical protein